MENASVWSRSQSPMNPQVAMKVLLIPVVVCAAAAQTTRSVAEGAYSQKQADRGRVAYDKQCANCHGAELRGGDETPALTGDKFLAIWRNHSVQELFERVIVSMPADRPGTLSRETTSDILAYIFAANKFPAGSGELSTESEALKEIRLQILPTPGPSSQA